MIDAPEMDHDTLYSEVAKCTIALGKRRFALEVLPKVLLKLVSDDMEPVRRKEK